MNKKTLYVLISFFAMIFCTELYATTSSVKGKCIDYVNPFIGTGGHGHTYPGATSPFGLVQLSPDTGLEGWDRSSGYHYSDSTIIGFSHTHLSGTGIGDFADVLLMPTVGDLYITSGDENILDKKNGYRSRFSHNSEVASPGYYSVYLEDYNIGVELTATSHCGMHRYTFDSNDKANVIIDLKHGLYSYVLKSRLSVVNDSTLIGYRISSGWAHLQPVYFVIKFSKSFDSHALAIGDKLIWNVDEARNEHKGEANVKGVLEFDIIKGEQLIVKVGISTTSIDNAYMNLESQISGFDFDYVKNKTQNIWEKELSKVKIEAPDLDKEIFYTSLYHSFVVPNNIADVDGTYIGPDGNIGKSESKKYYSTFSLWDTFRASHPLYTILQPKRTSEMVNSMLLHYSRWGYLPIWSIWGQESHVMIGNHAIPVIVDAFLKGIEGFDYKLAYDAVKNSSLLNNAKSPYSLIDKYGYVPNNIEESVSKTLELSYDDWCVSQMAKKIGNIDDYNFFNNRSKSFKNIFDVKTGFMRGKNCKGKWTSPFDPQALSRHGDYTEGNAFQYSWYVPHALDDLVALHGGIDKFSGKLNELFETKFTSQKNVSDVTGFIGQYAHGNEPSHHIAYLYNITKESWKTQKYVARICNEFYTNKPDGLIGNEDCGQMSSWYVFSSLGFYPVNPCGGEYWIGTPKFKEAIIDLDNGKQFRIIAYNISKDCIYVKKVKLNGKELNNYILNHKDIVSGGVLEFYMSDKPHSNRI